MTDGLPTAVRTQVAIIGGGPAGLTAAMLLAQHGVDVQLFEKRASTTRLPRAHLINQRTMEIFAGLGVADDVHAMSPPEDQWHRVGWYSSLGGDLPAQGRSIGSVQAWGGGDDAARYRAASPQLYANVPQMRLDPLLRDHAQRACPGRLHFGYDVVGLEEHGEQVHLSVRDTARGHGHVVTADYVIAADGGRFCAAELGVELTGVSQVYDMVTLHISADLSPWIDDPETLLYYFVNPGGRGSFAGALCAMGPTRWGAQSEEWSYHQSFVWGDPAARDEGGLVKGMRDTLGLPDLDVTVHAVSHWEFEGVLAERFRVGRTFLAGNAAHRHPPSGGLGLNSAVQDVHNLAWKLAYVLQGRAGDELLTTYDVERRAVCGYNVQHALSNAGGHRRIAGALGLHEGQDPAEGWEQLEVWLSDTPEGARRRAAAAEAVSSNSDDYGQLNVELGYVYRSAAVVDEEPTGAAAEFSVQEYQPSSAPGHHVPHAWLSSPTGRVSTYDVYPTTSFALFVTDVAAQQWEAALRGAVARGWVDVRLVVVGPGGAWQDVDGTWATLRGTTAAGAVLVRPDRHVAWRAVELPDDPEAALRRVMLALLPGDGER